MNKLNKNLSSHTQNSPLEQQPPVTPKHMPWQHSGKHLLAEFWQCQCDEQFLTNYSLLSQHIVTATQSVGLSIVGQCGHEFGEREAGSHSSSNSPQQNSGVTLTILLAESHICIHTWCEYQTVTLDIYVCNVLNDNSEKADKLLKLCQQLFLPYKAEVKSILRKHHI